MSDRSYDQWCGLALALDRLGDRWTLLVIRELLQGPRRYTDLRRNLPGVATNLLAERLRSLEDDGLIRRREFPPPTPVVLYELTEAGAGLEAPVLTLTRWGTHLMATDERPSERRASWLALALRAILEPRLTQTLTAAPEDFQVLFNGTDGSALRIVARGEHLEIVATAEPIPDLRATVWIQGDPATLLDVASGTTTIAAARRAHALMIRGPRNATRALAALFDVRATPQQA